MTAPPGFTRSAATRSSSVCSSGSGSAPAEIRPGGEHAEPRAGRVHEHPVEPIELRRELACVGVHDADVGEPEQAHVLVQLARPAGMELDGDDLRCQAGQLRRLPAGCCAQVEHALAGLDAHGGAGQLRTAALRPDLARSSSPGSIRSTTRASPVATTRTAVSGASFCARISASASSAPHSSHQVSATESGYECLNAASCAVDSGSAATRSRIPSATRRRTAFANPAARLAGEAFTSSTASFTLARAGTPSRNASS